MARIHDKFVLELAEVIKGYGNNPDVEDPFRLSEFYRFYELPNIAISRENFEKMKPLEDVAPVRRGRWITTRTQEHDGEMYCNQCDCDAPTEGDYRQVKTNFCPHCGAKMDGGDGDD